jgi:hypothetical protein
MLLRTALTRTLQHLKAAPSNGCVFLAPQSGSKPAALISKAGDVSLSCLLDLGIDFPFPLAVQVDHLAPTQVKALPPGDLFFGLGYTPFFKVEGVDLQVQKRAELDVRRFAPPRDPADVLLDAIPAFADVLSVLHAVGDCPNRPGLSCVLFAKDHVAAVSEDRAAFADLELGTGQLVPALALDRWPKKADAYALIEDDYAWFLGGDELRVAPVQKHPFPPLGLIKMQAWGKPAVLVDRASADGWVKHAKEAKQRYVQLYAGDGSPVRVDRDSFKAAVESVQPDKKISFSAHYGDGRVYLRAANRCAVLAGLRAVA